MVVQPGLCPTWSETPKTGFLRTRLICQRRLLKPLILESPTVIGCMRSRHSYLCHFNRHDSRQGYRFRGPRNESFRAQTIPLPQSCFPPLSICTQEVFSFVPKSFRPENYFLPMRFVPTPRETDIQTDSQAGRQAGRQTDSQSDR